MERISKRALAIRISTLESNDLTTHIKYTSPIVGCCSSINQQLPVRDKIQKYDACSPTCLIHIRNDLARCNIQNLSYRESERERERGKSKAFFRVWVMNTFSCCFCFENIPKTEFLNLFLGGEVVVIADDQKEWHECVTNWVADYDHCLVCVEVSINCRYSLNRLNSLSIDISRHTDTHFRGGYNLISIRSASFTDTDG